MDSVVYQAVFNQNGRCYIGQTSNLAKRINHHGYEEGYFGNALRKHGVGEFIWQILLNCRTRKEADFWEKFFIRELHTIRPNGFNLTLGGEGGDTFSNKTEKQKRDWRKKHSERMKNWENNPFKKGFKGKDSYWFGKSCPERSKRMKENNPMKRPEIAMKVRGENNGMFGVSGGNHPNYGKKNPKQSKRMKENNPMKRLEVRLKMSRNHADVSGKNNPMYGKKGKSNPNFGARRSDLTRRKMSLARNGYKIFI